MAVAILELPAECNEGLDVASRADDVNDDVKGRWSLDWPTCSV